MTCKDCIHYEVCVEHLHRFDCEYLSGDFEKEFDKHPCELFKDKSRLAELPCKPKDKVFFVWSHQVVETRIDTVEYCVYDGCQKIWIVSSGSVFEGWLGEEAFLTREEAKKKLKEMKR